LHISKLLSVRSIVKLFRLGALVRAKGIELVHIFLNDAAIAGPFFCRMGGADVIVSRRDMGFWYTGANLKALRISNRFVSRVIANSDAVRRNVHQWERYPAARIEVFHNGHPPDRFDVPP